MRITSTLLSLIFLVGTMAYAQDYSYSDAWAEAGFSVKETKSNKTVINFSIKEFSLNDVTINGESMKQIALPGHFLPNNEGAPNLPGNGRYIAIPNHADAELVVTNVRKETIENVNIAPSPRIPKDNEDGPLDFTKDSKIYSKNAFYPEKPFKISEKEMIRGMEVVMLGITPFQYNPVTKELIVYRDIEVEVKYNGGTGAFGQDKYRSRWFDPIIYDAVLNNQVIPEYDYNKRTVNRDGTGCEYLIVSPDGEEFQAWADSIRMFRNMQGIHTEVVTLSEIGANDPDVLEDYFDEAFNTWDTPPAAVLLLGDYGTSMENSVVSPIYDSYCVSDNIYADVTGNSMPDMVFARITANNAEQLEVMVSKFIHYEKNPPTNPDFYNNPISALGWQTERWFQLCSESVYGFWQNNLGKEPRRENVLYSGSTNTWSTATNTETIIDYFGESGTQYIEDTPDYLPPLNGSGSGVTDGINSGAFMLQHRDHGSETGWGEPDYDNGDIDDLYNTDLTFVMSINCLTGKYNISGECFAEKFHRHTNDDGENSGALGLIAASEISYSFVNDTYVWGAYDNMWPEFLPDYGSTPEPRGIKPAFGNAAGKYYLEQSDWPYNTNNKEVTYNLFHHHGGAFLTVYSEMPQDLNVVHADVLLSGPDFFEITADEGSLIALSVDGEILGAAEGTGSAINVPIEPQLPGTVVDVVVTKQNYFRYHQQVTVIPPDGPYVIKNDFELNDSYGNNNGMAEYGETVRISLTVENVGNEPAEDVAVTIASDDPYVTITDDTENYGTIPAESTMTIEDGYTVMIHDSIPDNHTVNFEVVAAGEEEWNSSFSFKIFAPVLSIGNITIDDSDGNDNGRLDPGEAADLYIEITNSGHCAAPEVLSEITSTTPTLSINSGEETIEIIEPEETAEAHFNVSVDAGAPVGSFVNINNLIECTPYEDERVYNLKVGLIVEDWESGDFSSFGWETAGSEEWFITENPVFEGTYASASGAISDGQQTEMSITYEVMYEDTLSFYRKVSSEGGYDYLRFYIDGDEVGAWAGELDWQKMSYPVSAGEHTFTWEYDKDGSVAGGADAAWVDFIVLPPELATTAYAGPDIQGCETMTVAMEGATATYYDEITWESSGTGVFNGMEPLEMEYTPSQDDYENGQVTLTMTVYGTGGDEMTDERILFLNGQPAASGVTDMEICANDSLMVEGIAGENYSGVYWHCDGDGHFTDSSMINPVYHPGANDIANGQVNMTMEVMAMGMCEDIEVQAVLTVNPVPDATFSQEIVEACEQSTLAMSGNVSGTAPWTFIVNEGQVEVNDAEFAMDALITSDTTFVIEQVADANGCVNVAKDTLFVTMNPLPAAPEAPSGNDSVDLVYETETEYTVTETLNATGYQWAIVPETAGTVTSEDMGATVVWDDAFTGEATITVLGLNDCGVSMEASELKVDVRNTVGFGEHTLANLIRVYPNPSKGIFTVSLNEKLNQSVNIMVRNTLSETVFEQKNVPLQQTDLKINLSDQTSGVYILIIETQNNQRAVKRLIIQ